MSGRPVHLLTAAIAAAASLLSVSSASAGCYSGCGGYGYTAPVAYYSAPVVYSYSYAAPVSYASPCANPCGSYGYASYGYAASPMYVVNQGPSYTAPVVGEAEGVYDTGYRRAYPYYADGGVRWHRRHWHHRGYSYRHHGYGYRRYGGFGYRHAWRPRHPMAGPGMWRHRYRTGLVVPRQWGGAIPPRHWNAAVRPHRMGGAPMHHMMRQPGAVHPRMGGGGAPKKLP